VTGAVANVCDVCGRERADVSGYDVCYALSGQVFAVGDCYRLGYARQRSRADAAEALLREARGEMAQLIECAANVVFERDGVIATRAPSRESYNAAFDALASTRAALASAPAPVPSTPASAPEGGKP
jgi:hypothetical protein